ncbi:MAG: hypothetical protein ABMA64_36845 [Myxococcota bacterium]
MSRWVWLSLVGVGASCSGDPPVERKPPEVCNDGLDNDEDGAADCDDTDCGGVNCQTAGDDDDDSASNLPLAEVQYDPTECCTFEYTSADCPMKSIGTITFVNRSSSDDGLIDVSCNLIGGEISAIVWQLPGMPDPKPFITDELLPVNTSLTAEAFFKCGGIQDPFTTQCIAKVAVSVLEETVEFEASGTPVE